MPHPTSSVKEKKSDQCSISSNKLPMDDLHITVDPKILQDTHMAPVTTMSAVRTSGTISTSL